MKKIILFLISMATTAQTVVYTADSNNILNPERGWYKYTKAVSTSTFSFLSPSSLNSTRVTDKCTLILRVYDLGAFKTTPISQTFLDNIQTDFNTLRASGVKCILRFRYSELDDIDAPKALLLSHIDQLKAITIPNQDVISCVEAGFIGKYGEWYYSSNYGTGTLTTQNLADRKEIGLKIMELAPNRMVAFRTPTFQTLVGGTTAITASEAYTGTVNSRIALHNDAFLSSSSDVGTFKNTSTEYPYLESQSKYTFCGGESNQLNTTYQNCTNALYTLNRFNYSYLNYGYHPDVLNYWRTNGCYSEIEKRLGYRFELINSSLVDNTLTITIRNTGFANLFNLRKAYLIYRDSLGNEYSYECASDVRKWDKSKDTVLNINLNTNLPDVTYKLFLNIPDLNISNPLQSIQLANIGTWESLTGYNDLQQTYKKTTTSSTPTVTIVLNSSNYIVVTGLTTFTIRVYNVNGKLVATTQDISRLRKGTYIVKVTSQTGTIYTQQIYKP